jgi:hypothetical protein
MALVNYLAVVTRSIFSPVGQIGILYRWKMGRATLAQRFWIQYALV